MPVTKPVFTDGVSEEYPLIGIYRTDSSYVPFFNQSETDIYLPGEPIRIPQAAEVRIGLSAYRINPQEVTGVHKNWIADFPCVLSGDVLEGANLWWDIDEVDADLHPTGAVVDAAPVNGFLIGVAGYAHVPGKLPTVSGGSVVCGNIASTRIRVVYVDRDSPAIGVLGSSDPQTFFETMANEKAEKEREKQERLEAKNRRGMGDKRLEAKKVEGQGEKKQLGQSREENKT